MTTDNDILDALEKEIGWRLPRQRIKDGLPLLDSPPADRKKKKGRALDFPPEVSEFHSDLDEEKFVQKKSIRNSRHDFKPSNHIPSFPLFGAVLNNKNQVVGLALTGLHLKKIPDLVWQFRHLKFLGFYDNRLRKIPNNIRSHPSLRKIGFRNNKITKIPPWVLEDNPLKSPPPEIIKRGLKAIAVYFKSIADETLPLNEAKILLVGDGAAGKTSFVRRLLGQDFNENESQTHGINIDPWNMTVAKRRIQLHMWDFGGQEIMHATHLFFLSERSLYILVLDGRKEEDPEYWLKHIESFGGDSPILVVLNKMDEHPAFDVNRRFLQRKYKGIVGFYPISCKSNMGMNRLKAGLRKGLQKVEIIQTTWPVKWFKIKDDLERMTSHFISLDEYEVLCNQAGIDVAEQRDNLVLFLNDLGVVVHYREFNLRHMHVLEPRWLTGAVYRIINAPMLAKRKGTLRLSSLPYLLRKKDDGYTYPSHTHSYILEIMKKFELCYSIDHESVLIPDLLDIQEPKIDFDYENAVKFRLDYDFLPKSVIPRFIVKKNRDISGQLRWRTGVVLADENFMSTAVVSVDVEAKRVHIYVNGKHRSDYLTVLRAVFLEINQGFEKLQVQERLCLPDNSEITVSFEHLTHLMNEGVEEIYPDGANHPYQVRDLLGIVAVDRKRTEQEFIRLLKEVLVEGDTKDTAFAKANRIVTLQPNFFGMGVNLNAIVDAVFPAKSKKKKQAKTRTR